MIFVEGIQKLGTDGDGFNSADYGFKFLVTKFTNTNPAEVEFNMTGIATNAGIAVTAQNGYATLIRKSNYPIFDVIQTPLELSIGEKILTSKDSSDFIERDLEVVKNNSDLLKVYGTYDLSVDEKLLGKTSGTEVTIDSIDENRGFFNIDYSLNTDIGWRKDTGKLNDDSQVTPNNDYYQNLSYSVKSSQTFDTIIDPVNRLLHTSGMKNFSDTGITNDVNVSIANTVSATSVALIDIISDKRVDVVKSFDFSIDVDVLNDRSKFIKLQIRVSPTLSSVILIEYLLLMILEVSLIMVKMQIVYSSS